MAKKMVKGEPDADDLPTSLHRKQLVPSKLKNKAAGLKSGKPMPPWMKK